MAKSTWILMGLFLTAATANAAKPMDNETIASELPRPETVAALRARGPEGLAEAVRIYDLAVAKRGRLNLMSRAVPPEEMAQLDREVEAWRTAVDEIGAQRGAATSRLYWYTNLAAAKAAAEQTGRSILSLRMLGKLTDEYSCANSRFFRTALYSNKEISDYLRDNFVLHWQSVRPVPRVTIDFGDGRKLERTVTGNSAHYALAPDGRPLDVLPGLYGPKQFRNWLGTIRALHSNYMVEGSRDLAAYLRQHHTNRRDALLEKWELEIQRLGDTPAALVAARVKSAIAAASAAGEDVQPVIKNPDARRAARQAISKSLGEVPVLRFANMGGRWIEKSMDEQLWQALADQNRESVKLDESSIAVIRREFPRAAFAARAAVTKTAAEDPILRLVDKFEKSIALDTLRNEYLLHRRVHEKFAAGDSRTADYDSLNEWVYAELFLTPSSDPWLGLAPTDVYTALDGNGQKEAAQ